MKRRRSNCYCSQREVWLCGRVVALSLDRSGRANARDGELELAAIGSVK